ASPLMFPLRYEPEPLIGWSTMDRFVLPLSLVVSLVAALASGACTLSESRAPTSRRSSTRRPSTPLAVTIAGERHSLSGELLLPEGFGPFPALIYNHGSERHPSLKWLGKTARWFQRQGFVVLIPYRRGHATTPGAYFMDRIRSLPLDERDSAFVEAFEGQTDDVLQAVEWLARVPFVDPKRVVVGGCSVGGILTILAAERGAGILAALAFASASMLWHGHPEVRRRLLAAVQQSKVPLFLLQAENDFDTTPTRALDAALTAAGKPHRSQVYPRFGTSAMAGHAGFCNRAQALWGPDVLAFIARLAGD
ncbi:MAG: dienelactone hydrolase family protein, partial [Myxococcales bacterium]|nr:dienelactone hydrolase family protein [Myxococcales bacterium]